MLLMFIEIIIYWSTILIGSIHRKDENYYSKVFLEKYYFIENIEIFCSDSDEECYHEERIFFLETVKKKEKFF